jgi:hypothetical protein
LGLLAAGFSHDAIITLITIGGSALGAAFLVPVGELGWAWLQAPMRMLTEDVVAIRSRLEGQSGGYVPAPPMILPKPASVRLALLDFARKGEDILRLGTVQAGVLASWTDTVVAFLAEYAAQEQTESFLAASDLRSARATCAQRVLVLQDIAKTFSHDA